MDRVTASADFSLGSTLIPMRFQTSDGTTPETRIVVCADGSGGLDGFGGSRPGSGSGGSSGLGGPGGLYASGPDSGSGLARNALTRAFVSKYTSDSKATSAASSGVSYHTRS